MEAIKEKILTGKKVELDDTHFISCKFKDCTLIYKGGKPPIFDGCEFGPETQIQFTNNALYTHSCMEEIYHKVGGPGQKYVENLYDCIRKNIPPTKIELPT